MHNVYLYERRILFIVRSKRNREFEKQIHREATRDEQDLVSLDCAVCRATCMKLKLESNALISQLPKVRERHTQRERYKEKER